MGTLSNLIVRCCSSLFFFPSSWGWVCADVSTVLIAFAWFTAANWIERLVQLGCLSWVHITHNERSKRTLHCHVLQLQRSVQKECIFYKKTLIEKMISHAQSATNKYHLDLNSCFLFHSFHFPQNLYSSWYLYTNLKLEVYVSTINDIVISVVSCRLLFFLIFFILYCCDRNTDCNRRTFIASLFFIPVSCCHITVCYSYPVIFFFFLYSNAISSKESTNHLN